MMSSNECFAIMYGVLGLVFVLFVGELVGWICETRHRSAQREPGPEVRIRRLR